MDAAGLGNGSFVEYTGAILDEDPGLSESIYSGTGLSLPDDAQTGQGAHGSHRVFVGCL